MDDVLSLTGVTALHALIDEFRPQGIYIQPLYEPHLEEPQITLCLRSRSSEQEIGLIAFSASEPGILCIENLDVFSQPGEKRRRKGIASKMTALSIEAGARHGLETVTTTAVELGVFYWAAVGFEPVGLDEGFRPCFNRHAHKIQDVSLRERLAAKIDANDPSVVRDVLALTQRPHPGAPTLAQSIFRKTAWKGAFNTRNPAQVAQLRRVSKLDLAGLG